MSEPLLFRIELSDEEPPQSAGAPRPGPAAPEGLTDALQRGPQAPQQPAGQAQPTGQPQAVPPSAPPLPDLRKLETVPVAVVGPFPIPVSMAGTVLPGTLPGSPGGAGGAGGSPGVVEPPEERPGWEIPYATDRRAFDEPGGAPPGKAPRPGEEGPPSLTKPAGEVGFGDILKEWARQSVEAIGGPRLAEAMGLSPVAAGAKQAAERAEMGWRAREDEEEERDFGPVTRRPGPRAQARDVAGPGEFLDEVRPGMDDPEYAGRDLGVAQPGRPEDVPEVLPVEEVGRLTEALHETAAEVSKLAEEMAQDRGEAATGGVEPAAAPGAGRTAAGHEPDSRSGRGVPRPTRREFEMPGEPEPAGGPPKSPIGEAGKQAGPEPAGGAGGFRAGGSLPGFGSGGSAGGAGGAAEAGGLAEEIGMAAEAGPAAPVVLAAEEAKKAILKGIDFVGDVAQAAGNQASRLANNQNYEAISAASHGAAEALNKLGPIGEIAGHSLEAVTKTADAFNQAVDSFVARGRELAQYDAGLAGAGAQADVRSLLEDIKEAQTLSEPLSRLTEAQSEASAELREILLPIKKWIVEELADIMESIVDFLRGLKAGIDISVEVAKGILNVLNDAVGSGHIKDIAAHMGETADHVKEIMEALKKPTNPDTQFDAIIGDLLNQAPGVPLPLPAGLPDPAANAPFIGGGGAGGAGGLPGGLPGGF